ncbi:hypothetical protein FRAAL1436 [Frankia alni ACN14a]|uniref:Uncharacterized protein n=1 Tax=Frankia alni (strain DSM 45986 / CECT 9034 / ACN14a) TaxID=326424 RepID=Q0RQS9_FRAAA|nr:hypothetical protein FRAAL1436 [Frankia alni ACN14a]
MGWAGAATSPSSRRSASTAPPDPATPTSHTDLLARPAFPEGPNGRGTLWKGEVGIGPENDERRPGRGERSGRRSG